MLLVAGKHLARLGYAYMSWGKLREARIALQKSLFVEESPSVRRYLNEVEQRLTFEKSSAKVSNSVTDCN
jgi:hypothetical protein